MNAITLPSARAYNIIDHTYDVVVVGAKTRIVQPARDHLRMGAAGLKADVHRKVFPTREPPRSRRKAASAPRSAQHGPG